MRFEKDDFHRGSPNGQSVPALDAAVAREIARAIRDLRYGSIEIVVHGGRVVQIERKEKIRFAAGEAAGAR